MSLILKTLFKPSSDGTGAIFNDITGQTDSTAYGQNGNIAINDVTAVRIKIATFTSLSELAMLKADEKFTQYKEYQKTGGEASVIDGKTLYVGNSFVPRLENLIIPTGDTWIETGYYVYPFLYTWLPGSLPNTISFSKLGQTGPYVNDDVYSYTYEVYYNSVSGYLESTVGAVYLCTDGSSSYKGNTYYAGDIFYAVDSSEILIDGFIAQLYASTDAYSVLSFNTKSSLYQLVVEKAGSNCLKCWTEINNIKTQLDAIGFMSETGNVALGPASKTLEWVNDSIRNFPTCNC